MYIAVVIVYRSVSRNAHPGDHGVHRCTNWQTNCRQIVDRIMTMMITILLIIHTSLL